VLVWGGCVCDWGRDCNSLALFLCLYLSRPPLVLLLILSLLFLSSLSLSLSLPLSLSLSLVSLTLIPALPLPHQMKLLQLFYEDPKGVNYRRFLEDVLPRIELETLRETRMQTLRAQKPMEDAARPLDADDVLLKIRTQVCVWVISCLCVCVCACVCVSVCLSLLRETRMQTLRAQKPMEDAARPLDADDVLLKITTQVFVFGSLCSVCVSLCVVCREILRETRRMANRSRCGAPR
jgi:hypothetical protein